MDENQLDMDSDMVVLGNVSGVFGIKGWVKIFSETRPKEAICQYKKINLLLHRQWKEYAVETIKPQGKTIVAKLKGIETPEEAQLLQGANIAVSVEDLPKLTAGHYYWRDLIGLKVENTEGIDFGRVDSILETGANDVLIVRDVENKKERLVPFTVGNAIVQVDLDEQLILVDWDADF